MSKFAVIIGVTDCHADLQPIPSAQCNAEAIQRILQDSTIGDFDHIELQLNPELGTMQRSIGKVLAQCQAEDLALLYFSGHALSTTDGELYFAARDTEPAIFETAIPAQFIQKALDRCRAKRQIVILDCCFSDMFAELWQVNGSNHRELQQQLGAEGRIILMASSFDRRLWNDADALSAYTQVLVEGIESGKVDRLGHGEIRIRDLHDYALEAGKFEQFGIQAQILIQSETYDITVGNHAVKRNAIMDNPLQTFQPYNTAKAYPVDALSQTARTSAMAFSPLVGLSNILTPFVPYITKLITVLKAQGGFTGEARSPLAWHNLKLAVLQTVLGAENVVLWQGETTESIQPILQSNLAADNGSESLRWVLNERGTARIFAPESCGVCLPEEAGGTVLVPVVSEAHVVFLALHGLPLNFLQEPLACLISQFYQIEYDKPLDPSNIEGLLIDAWKRRFQFMPSSLYERRFTLFCARLKQMQVFFQPIIQLRPLMLSGWEALARDRTNHQTPVDLFKVAELWGRQFIIELDLHFLMVAAETYREQTEQFGIAPLPLSINVYPDSLLQKSYLTCLQRLVSHGVIASRNLVLEISEKQEIVYTPSWSNHSPVNQSFRKKLKEIARNIPHIRFAIDDYGSNHATVSRLLGLCLDYVKIDREVLYCDPDACRTVLRFIQNLMIEQGCFQPYIVMEGVDNDCPMQIGELSNLGISHIQGFGVGIPQAEIYADLSPELRDRLSQQLQTSDDYMMPTF
jgi:EAL domain-containing protein (putative c-di-GMP-specific phosphodiesterase class I)